MREYSKLVHLYIGCVTNKGKLVGVVNDILFIQAEDKNAINEYHTELLGKELFLYLKKLDSLTDSESKELMNQGISIGRPHGYTFSNNGILYLLSLHVDLFGFINNGIAKELTSLT